MFLQTHPLFPFLPSMGQASPNLLSLEGSSSPSLCGDTEVAALYLPRASWTGVTQAEHTHPETRTSHWPEGALKSSRTNTRSFLVPLEG